MRPCFLRAHRACYCFYAFLCKQCLFSLFQYRWSLSLSLSYRANMHMYMQWIFENETEQRKVYNVLSYKYRLRQENCLMLSRRKPGRRRPQIPKWVTYVMLPIISANFCKLATQPNWTAVLRSGSIEASNWPQRSLMYLALDLAFWKN